MFKRFLEYYKPYGALLTLDLSCALGLGLADLVYPAATQRVVDVIVPAGDLHGLARFAVLLVILYAVRAGLEFIVGSTTRRWRACWSASGPKPARVSWPDERPFVEFSEGLLQLVAGIHHDGTAPGYWLVQG